VADDADGLAGRDEVAHEAHRILVHPQPVGVARPAGQEQRVVVGDRRVAHLAIDRECAGRLEVAVHRLDLAVVERQQVGLRAGVLHDRARLLQLDLLEAVGGEDRDLQVAKFVRHAHSFGCGAWIAPPSSRGP